MKTWYARYQVLFGKSWANVPQEIKLEIRQKMLGFFPENPLISVVLIAHNEEKHIAACLWSLCNNIFPLPAEIIVVDNLSVDHTAEILNELGVVCYKEQRKGPGFARACGLARARGKYHLCIDSDTLYPPRYVSTHVRLLQYPGIVCTYSLWSFLPDEEHSRSSLFWYESLRDIYLNIQNIKRPEKNVRGMALAFHTELARQVGFHTNIIRGEDGMMALGLKKYGKLRFIRSTKARVMTCNTTLNSGGSLWQNFLQRFKKGITDFTGLFYTKTHYEDKPFNMIDKKNRESDDEAARQ